MMDDTLIQIVGTLS